MFKTWNVFFFLTIISVISCAQEIEVMNNPVKKNSISYSVLGTSGIAGISYERFVSSRICAEIGAGLVGVGLGAKYYSTVETNKLLINIGLTLTASPLFNTTDFRIIEGNGFLIYLPVGLSYFGRKNLNLGIDIGPATTFVRNYNGSYLNVYGNFKIGFRF